MEAKLTPQIAAAYYGCLMRTWIAGLQQSDTPLCNKFLSWSPHELTERKLVLTPLSEITTEHAIEVARIVRPDLKIEDCEDDNWVESFNKKIVADVAKIHPFKCLCMWDYLRMLGYDCGYGSITSLIDAGIAIKK